MFHLNFIPKFKINHKFKYEICAQSKQTRKPFKSISHQDTQLLELIHTNVYDSCRNPTHSGSHCFVIFIDNFFKYCYSYLLKTKDEVFNKFKVFKAEAENQLKRRLKF